MAESAKSHDPTQQAASRLETQAGEHDPLSAFIDRFVHAPDPKPLADFLTEAESDLRLLVSIAEHTPDMEEANQIYERIDREIAVEEARADRLLRLYDR